MDKFTQSSFARFFTRFPKLLLSGLLFSIPFTLFTAIFVLIGYITGFNNIIVWGLGIIPSMPFYAGLLMVVRKYSVDKLDVKVFATFFQNVRDNVRQFLVHGAAFYVIIACAFFSVVYYYTLAQTDVVYSSVLTIYLIFIFLLLAMMFYVPLLSVTYALRLRDLYKNSFLLVFGKILRSLIAMVTVLIVSAAAFLFILFSKGVWLIVAVSLTVIMYPMIACYIINSVIADGVQDAMGRFTGENVEYAEPKAEVDEAEALRKADKNSDYVFVNGRMIKNPSRGKKPENTDGDNTADL